MTDDDRLVMRIFVQVDSLRTQRSGHLWWRKWSEPQEFVVLHIVMDDGTYDEAWLWGDSLEDELHEWSSGTFVYQGNEFALQWLDAIESVALRREIGLVEVDQVVTCPWSD